MAKPLVAVLVAGHEYGIGKNNHWDRCCSSREKVLARRYRTSLFIALTFDVSAGLVKKAIYRPSASAPTRTSYSLKEPIRSDQYKRIPNHDPVPFKRLDKIMSVMDIYREILNQLGEIGGKIVELSFFSHAYADGPILTNTWAFRRVVGEGSEARLVDVQQIASNRDGADLDPRMQDFLKDVQPEEARLQWRSAFAPEGCTWVWGCNASEEIMRLMRVVRRAIPAVTVSSSDLKIVLVRPRDYELQSINYISPNLLVLTKQTGTFEITVGAFRSFIFKKLSDTYAQCIANATGRPAYAAGPGTYATFRNNGVDLEVPAVVRDIVQTYKSSLGVQSDLEGWNYLKYKPKEASTTS